VDRIVDNRKQYDKAREGLQKKFNSDAASEGAVYEGDIKL